MLARTLTSLAVCLTLLFAVPIAPASASSNALPPVAEAAKKRFVDLDSPSRFGFREKSLPGAQAAVNRGIYLVGRADRACSNLTCEGLCLHLAAKVWGHAYSGSPTAIAHWERLREMGQTRSDRQPPVGALVYWDINWSGHVAVYVGDGMVVSNWDGPHGDGVYLLPIDIFENEWSSAKYLGWSQPTFFGPRV